MEVRKQTQKIITLTLTKEAVEQAVLDRLVEAGEIEPNSEGEIEWLGRSMGRGKDMKRLIELELVYTVPIAIP